ncbi:MAG: HEPN domain-containing protein [Myxococcota bacterium]|nr:HEPN domain-containing protein [Myxococcota bacterium]
MPHNPSGEATRWLRQAERDLDDARYLLAGDRYGLACFVAQQAAEKALKAFLYAAGAEEVWGHSVADLCSEATALDAAFDALRPTLAPLDKFYVPTRYPDGLPGGIPAEAFSRADAEGALSMAATAVEAVRRALEAA